MLSDRRSSKYPRQLIKLAKEAISAMEPHCNSLSNFISSDNQEGINFVEHLGFTVDRENEFEINSIKFIRFDKPGKLKIVNSKDNLPCAIP
jgi:hypothetical protein